MSPRRSARPARRWSTFPLASSAALEIARRRLHAGFRSAFNHYWTAGTILGVLFLAGQAYAWQELKQAGIFLATNPGSSFFYLFTATHGIHLLGGIAALAWVSVQALRLRLGPGKRTAEYIDFVLTRLTVIGAAYITIVCVLPEGLIGLFGNNSQFYLGGTSILIVVTVTMDTVAQIQSHLLAHQYEGLIKKSKLRGGRSGQGSGALRPAR